jgi:hypothetical protein
MFCYQPDYGYWPKHVAGCIWQIEVVFLFLFLRDSPSMGQGLRY